MSTSRMKQEIHCSFSWTLQCCEVCHFSFLVRTVVKWWQQHHRSGPASCIPSTEKSSSKSQKMNLWWAQSFVTKDSLAGGRPQPARLPDVGGPKWFELQKNTGGRELLCFFSTFFQFLLKLVFFLLGLTKILIPHATAFFFPGWGVLSTDKENQKRDIHWKPRKDRCLLALRYCEPGLAGGVLSPPMALCCYVSLLECMPVYAFFVLMPISI